MPADLKAVKDDLRSYRGKHTYTGDKKMSVRYWEHPPVATPGTKALYYRGVVDASGNGEEDSYLVQVRFFGLDCTKEEPKGKKAKSYAKHDVKGVDWWIEIPDVTRHGVQLKCQCADFRFSFEKELFDANGLIGNWRRYKRKTPPKTRPANPVNPNPIGKDFVNPDNYLGYCKHVWAFLKALADSGEIKRV